MKEYVFSKPGEELVKYVTSVWKGQKSQQTNHVFRAYVQKAHRYYFGNAWSGVLGTDVTGEQAEFSTISINEARADIKAVVSMVTQNRLAFDAITSSTDVSAQNNIVVANALLEQVFYVDKAETKARQMLEQGLVYGTSYFYVGFTTAAELAGVGSDGKGVYKGKLDLKPLNILDVKVEDNKEQWDEHDYVMFRRLENRYELAEKYPEVADELLNAPPPDNLFYPNNKNPEEHADIWVFYTFHKPCKALPQGRMVLSTENDVILFDDVNPYECIPVVCYRPNIRYGSSYGHALFWDLLPVQEAMNTLDSSNLTMLENFAIPNIVASNTFKATETAISGGMKLITGAADPNAPNGGFPAPMNMPSPNPAYQQVRQTYENALQKLSGVNAASRGQTTSQQSGTAIALAQSAAQTYNSSVEAGYLTAVEQIADLIVRVCRLFMTRQEITSIAGMALDYQTETFTTASLDAISRVRVNIGNAMAKTISGRLEIATQLLNQQMINATEYMSILMTGNLPGKVSEKSSQELLVSGENELLAQGESPIVNVLDNHVMHITRHRTLLDSPIVRRNSNLIALIMSHIEEHVQMLLQLQQGNPLLLDVALGNPLGTSGQMAAGPVAPPGTQGGQMSPEDMGSAVSAAEGGPEGVAEKGREMAQQRLEQVGGEPNAPQA
jgi:hypothetical protein